MTKIISLIIVISGVILIITAVQLAAPSWLLISILVGLFLLLLGLTAVALAWNEPNWPILLFLGACIITVVPGLSGLHPWVAPGIIGLGGIALLIAIIVANKKVGGYLLGDHWHLTKKGLGGTIFADIANMIGVLAGIGAYRLVSDNPQLVKSFWWIGQMAAYLAAVVSLSLLWRWGNTPAGSGEGKQKWPALFNWAVAAGTIVSLYAPTTSNMSIAGLEAVSPNDEAGVAAGGAWLGLLIILVAVSWILFIARRQRFWEDGKGRAATLLFNAITIASILAVIFAIIGARDSQVWSTASAIIGVLAVFAWISGEFYNYVGLTRDFKANQTYISVLDYMDWEKNFWEIVGGLGTILFLIGHNFFRDTFGDVNDIMFYIAATLGFLGTLRGILRGILKQLYSDDYEAQMTTSRAVWQRSYRTVAAESVQQQHEIQVRNGQIQQLQGSIAGFQRDVIDLDAQIRDLEREIRNKEGEIRGLEQRTSDQTAQINRLNEDVARKDRRILDIEREKNEQVSEMRETISDLRQEITRLQGAVETRE